MARQNSSQLYLSPDQQDLLMAALSSNQTTSPEPKHYDLDSPAKSDRQRRASSGLYGTRAGSLDFGTDESPYLDFELEGDLEDGFNFDGEGRMIGDLPGDDAADHLHDKRKSIDGQDDDDEGGGKRREGEDKTGKKPGRKPLTSEPTTKRKAQNRAAQRAFRERKEKHLKDLETKVEDLEKASESANHENGLLRAQVERLQIELKEYRKRLSSVGTNGLSKSPVSGPFSYNAQARVSGPNQNDFQFEFPKFGDLPGNHLFSNDRAQKSGSTPARSATLPSRASAQPIPGILSRSSMSASPQHSNSYGMTGNSRLGQTLLGSPTSPQGNHQPSGIDSLSDLFSPSILEASRNSYFVSSGTSNGQTGRGSGENAMASLYSNSSVSTDSPSSSSDSHQQNSSIGTSPEPSLSSPGNKYNENGLNTIKEQEQMPNLFGGEKTFCRKLSLACGNAKNPIPAMMNFSNRVPSDTFTPGTDPNGINWFATQNGGNFDPVLFGDYRESQNAIVSQDFGTFFNDAFPLPDLGSPLHNFNDVAPSPAPKADLLEQVDAAREAEEVVPGEDRAKLMTCNKIWDRLQSMEKFRNGEIDVDNLCSELRAKARCSEGGAVVNEKDVDKILKTAK